MHLGCQHILAQPVPHLCDITHMVWCGTNLQGSYLDCAGPGLRERHVKHATIGPVNRPSFECGVASCAQKGTDQPHSHSNNKYSCTAPQSKVSCQSLIWVIKPRFFLTAKCSVDHAPSQTRRFQNCHLAHPKSLGSQVPRAAPIQPLRTQGRQGGARHEVSEP